MAFSLSALLLNKPIHVPLFINFIASLYQKSTT
nr:MAG TPA: hypothetical protein [Caudoviricetes sp.]